jgi:predicted RNA-binding Zn-ribbon protein involved in translation (DUF1610 family)
MNKNVLFGIILLLVGAGGGYWYIHSNAAEGGSRQEHATSGDEICPEHKIAEKDCPWCDKSLISSKGQCKEHNVPEALCSRCNPALIPGFKAEHDWCAGHNVPESQCKLCQAGELPPGEE